MSVEWQPIETAPEGIAEVMLAVDWKRLVYIGYRSEHVKTGEKGWVASEFFGEARFCPYQPTHWAPLPPPPSSQPPAPRG